MGLAVPLKQKQVDAACRLHQRLDQWRLSDAALKRLHDTLPGFDAETCLLKSIAINALYGAQVFAIVRMAEHVQEVLSQTNTATADPNLVERIAALPAHAGEESRQFVSFAAKLCHFFVDAERFPIYDEAARNVIKLHLGVGKYDNSKAHPYVAFCRNFRCLRDEAGLKGHGRELDRYLWITGMYMKWQKLRRKKSEKMNAELRRLFERPSREVAAELDALLPSVLDRAFRGEL